MNTVFRRAAPLGPRIAGYALAVRRRGALDLLSFHQSQEEAQGASRRVIDCDALQVVEATIVYAANGNVRMCDLVDPHRVPSVDELTARLVPRRAARRLIGIFDHSRDSWDMRTTQERACRIRRRVIGVRAPLTNGLNDMPIPWNSYHC